MTLKLNRVRVVAKYMFVQNIIKLSAALHELSCAQRKNSDENIGVRCYRADSNKHPYLDVRNLALDFTDRTRNAVKKLNLIRDAIRRVPAPVDDFVHLNNAPRTLTDIREYTHVKNVYDSLTVSTVFCKLVICIQINMMSRIQ